MDAAGPQSTFVRLGPSGPSRPVLLAVPHAGRDYPQALLANALVPRDRLEALEDRHADALIEPALAAGTVALVACRPRCWLDLNRDEREIDPATVSPPPPAHRLIQSAKLRGGLGLIPRRMPGASELWRAPVPAGELEARIANHHRPFHAAIGAELAAMQVRFGAALLIDLHSMPPVPVESFGKAPQLVIGDRYGRSASSRLVDVLSSVARQAGLTVAHNAPYAGGYTLDRHGRPDRGIHAVQIEVDRTLYLCEDRRTLGPGTGAVAALVAALLDTASAELVSYPPAIAAE
jgi:N-formylglutamate amidohydrolase